MSAKMRKGIFEIINNGLFALELIFLVWHFR